jgi:hypothetical protein
MNNLSEYLRAYWVYVSTGLGLGKALLGAVVWLTGMFAPLAAKSIALVPLPSWFMIAWMLVWALLTYVFAPYGMWKHHRAQRQG